MNSVFKNKRISGILSVLPENEIYFDDEVENYTFPPRQTLRLKKIMGFEKHRIAKDETSTSDLCVYGLEYLLEKGALNRDEIGAIVAVTITPDHFVPHVGTIVQGKLGLSQEVFCIDITQGCAGFIMGLMEAYMLLEVLGDKKVVLLNADVLSHRVSKKDRGSYPLVGDAAAITIVENAPSKDIYCGIRMDGTRGDALVIPAGGSRMPCTEETARMVDAGDGNIRSKDHLVMNGQAVFDFVQRDAPGLIEDVLAQAGVVKEDIDWYLFHQPNEFMLQKLAERLAIPFEKVPMNIVREFGNPSGASIPVDITHNLASLLANADQLCCLSAFGGGLCCGAIVTEIGHLDFCEMIESNL